MCYAALLELVGQPHQIVSEGPKSSASLRFFPLPSAHDTHGGDALLVDVQTTTARIAGALRSTSQMSEQLTEKGHIDVIFATAGVGNLMEPV
jgi:hypothetical protein